MSKHERALWLADKLTGDYGSEAAQLLRFFASITPQAGATTGTSFEGLKRPSSLDQSHPRNPDLQPASVVEGVAESTSVLRGAGASPLSHQWDRDGERCVKCGAKDWMEGPCSTPSHVVRVEPPLVDEEGNLRFLRRPDGIEVHSINGGFLLASVSIAGPILNCSNDGTQEGRDAQELAMARVRAQFSPPSATAPSKEEAYRRAFVLLLAEVMASGWFHADPGMKAKVVAYLHSVKLDEEQFTVEKVLHDAMGIPTDAERAFVASDGGANNG